MNRPRFEVSETALGFVARFVHPDYPKEAWSCRPWREHRHAIQSIYLFTGNEPVINPPGIPWARGVDFDPHGFVEIRELGDEKSVRTPARLGRPPRQVYAGSFAPACALCGGPEGDCPCETGVEG